MPHADEIRLLRHTLATLAYRGGKVLREFPVEAAERRFAPALRTPRELVSHLADLMEWARSLTEGESRWQAGDSPDWQSACARFFAGLAALDHALAQADPRSRPPGQIFQGPIADALTHVGQLALLRGAFGAPVKPESFARAEIEVGRVGREQAPARFEFDGDASRPRGK